MRNGRQRDLAATRDKLLKAAFHEFCAKGPAGARTEAIARRAGVNKRMLFYCFGSKSQLYAEVMRRKLAERAALLDSTPRDIAAALMLWCAGPQDPDWIRCVHWEALDGNGTPVAQAQRRALFARALRMLGEWSTQGALDPDLDRPQLLVAIVALSIFPLAFPHLVELITGHPPDHPDFQRKRRQFAAWLTGRIGPSPSIPGVRRRTGDKHKPGPAKNIQQTER